MSLTDDQIDAIFGDSPFIVRRTTDKSRFEVVENKLWPDAVSEVFEHHGYFATHDDAETAQRRLHVRWVLDGSEHLG